MVIFKLYYISFYSAKCSTSRKAKYSCNFEVEKMDVGTNYQDAIDEDIISDLRNYFPPETPEKDIIGKYSDT